MPATCERYGAYYIDYIVTTVMASMDKRNMNLPSIPTVWAQLRCIESQKHPHTKRFLRKLRNRNHSTTKKVAGSF